MEIGGFCSAAKKILNVSVNTLNTVPLSHTQTDRQTDRHTHTHTDTHTHTHTHTDTHRQTGHSSLIKYNKSGPQPAV